MTTPTTAPPAGAETSDAPPRSLSDLEEPERYRALDALQQRMPGVWDAMRRDFDDESVVVVPSVSLEHTTAGTGTLVQAMEERALFQVLLLRQPRLRMVFVTSMPVPEAILEYYLGLLPGVIPSHARSRLTMVSVGDATAAPLSAKLLARPRLLQRIRSCVPNPERSHLIFYNVTDLERDVALGLGLPLYGSDPRLAALGSKSGCRRIFAELGVPCPFGAEDLHSVDDLVTAVSGMRRERPAIQEAIVKLNDGVSGSGNAMLDLRDLPVPGAPDEAPALVQRLQELRPESAAISVDAFLDAFDRGGGIVEERIRGVRLTSPSVQMRATPDGTVELLSTHDQLLGGPTGQAYLGCVFPADTSYAALITEPAMTVGRHLAGLGVLGRFAVDFVVVQDDRGTWTPYAIELNLRKGGTTHPFLTLQFLTNGSYDGETGTYLTAGGVAKYLVATDHLEDERLKTLGVADLFDLVATRGLHFDQSHERGIVFHMISCLTECGRLGMTAVGDSPEDAEELYRRAERLLLEEAELAGAERLLVP